MCICVYVVYHPSHAFPLSGFWSLTKIEGRGLANLACERPQFPQGGLNKLEAVSVQVVDREEEEAKQGSQ